MSIGPLYVVATLLPLASFLVLFLGGRRWGRLGAFVATAAIGGACVISLAGFITYVSALPGDHDHHGGGHGAHAAPAHRHGGGAEHKHDDAAEQKDAAEPKAHAAKPDEGHPLRTSAVTRLEDDPSLPPWRGSIPWAAIHFKSGDEPAMVLTLGYYIDGLAATMFLMITFIA